MERKSVPGIGFWASLGWRSIVSESIATSIFHWQHLATRRSPRSTRALRIQSPKSCTSTFRYGFLIGLQMKTRRLLLSYGFNTGTRGLPNGSTTTGSLGRSGIYSIMRVHLIRIQVSHLNLIRPTLQSYGNVLQRTRINLLPAFTGFLLYPSLLTDIRF